MAWDCHRVTPALTGAMFSEISRTNRENGSFNSRRSVDFWYCLISFKALVPGLYLRFLRSVPSFLVEPVLFLPPRDPLPPLPPPAPRGVPGVPGADFPPKLERAVVLAIVFGGI